MTQEELMQKAAIATSDLTSGGLLNEKQATKFIDFVVDESVMAKEARIIRMDGRKEEIDKIGIGARVSVKKTEATSPGTGNYAVPTFSKVTLDTVDIMTPWELTYDALRKNIEGQGLENTIIKLMAKQVATDHEELYIQADTGSADTYLAMIDGWLKLADSGHSVDNEGNYLSTKFLSRMLKSLPNKYKRLFRDLRFYLAPDLYQDYNDLLSARQTVEGDRLMISGGVLQFNGVPLISVPLIPSDEAGTGTASDITADISNIILTSKSNLIVGIDKTGIMIEKDKDIFRGVRQYAITTHVDCEYEEVDAVVKGFNVRVNNTLT